MVGSTLASEAFMLWVALHAGSFVAGLAGFGLAAAAGAILLHAQPPQLIIPLLMVCSVVAQTLGLVYLRKGIEWWGSVVFALGGLAGAPLAVAVFGRLDAETFRKACGVFLIVYGGYALARRA